MWAFFQDQILCALNGGVPWIREVPMYFLRNCAKLIVSYFDLLQTSCTQNLTINRVPTFWNIVRSKPFFCINLLNKFNRESSFCNIVHTQISPSIYFLQQCAQQISSSFFQLQLCAQQIIPTASVLQHFAEQISFSVYLLQHFAQPIFSAPF